MNFSPAAVDYTIHFEYKLLQKIHGEPTYEDVTDLKYKLHTGELGGGAHCHLGLVLSATEYAGANNTPYISPVHPGPLVIPSGTPKYQAQILCKQ